MAQTENLANNFLDELFKGCFFKKEILEIVITHVKYNYIPNELQGYKKILKCFNNNYLKYKTSPTIGIVAQECNDEEVQKILDRIDKIKKLPSEQELLDSLTDYLKRVMFQELHIKLVDLYNSDKQEEAIKLQASESEKIVNFSVYEGTSYFEDVFEGFWERNEGRIFESQYNKKEQSRIPWGIDFLDALTHGGLSKEEGDTSLLITRSGTGKTKYLRWLGVSAARRGKKVLHIQGEGTKQTVLDGYDATWTAVLKNQFTDISAELENKLKKIIADIRKKNGGIKVVAYEQFETATMRDVRNNVLDYKKIYGVYPDEILLDYIGLFDPGDGKRYPSGFEGEKLRKEASARRFRNICNEFKIVGHTADQVDSISPQEYNNSSFVITRFNCALAKGLPESFSAVLTLNVTKEEYEKDQARLYVDKFRNWKGNYTFPICTNYDRDRFYDRARTLDLFAEVYNKQK